MIEFRGQLSSVVEKRILHNQRTMEAKLIFFVFLIMLPSANALANFVGHFAIVWVYAGMLVCLPIIALTIPRSKKEKQMFTPKSMVIDEDSITCKKATTCDVRYFEDVKTVRDFGEFYEFVFRFGKISTHFICQKDLLVKGTLEEFEALFDGKIEKVESK